MDDMVIFIGYRLFYIFKFFGFFRMKIFVEKRGIYFIKIGIN